MSRGRSQQSLVTQTGITRQRLSHHCEIRRCRVGRYSRGHNLSRQVSSTASLRRTSTPVRLPVSTAHVVESTDVSAFPAEVIDVKTGVEEPPVAVQATAPFFPAAEKEIVRNVTEKRLLHRVFIATQSPNPLHEFPDGTFSLFAPDAPVARRIVSSSPREGDCSS